jgi:hypothetical protein
LHTTIAALVLCAVLPDAVANVPAGSVATPQLVSLFTEWRDFATPERRDGVVDFGTAALSRKTAGLARLRARLAALDRTHWTDTDRIDVQLIEAQMNGLDFDLRLRRPWARDPGYYATVFGDESDVPAHEGPSADRIDLFEYSYPLNAAAERALATRLAGVPELLARAKTNLAAGDAADLWRYGSRVFREQEATLAALLAGTLSMRTHDGQIRATLDGAAPAQGCRTGARRHR